MLKNSFSFEGRARRTDYGISFLLATAVFFFIFILIGAIAKSQDGEISNGAVVLISILYLVVAVSLSLFMLAAGARRCHDMDKSGWYQLIPFFGFLLLFVEGTRGANRFGADPKSVTLSSPPSPAPTPTQAPNVPPTPNNKPQIWRPDDLNDEIKDDELWKRQVFQTNATNSTPPTSKPSFPGNQDAQPAPRSGKTGPYQPGRLYN